MAPLFLTLWRFIRAVINGFKDPEFKALFLVTALILLSGMFFYHEVEGWSMLNSLYFSVTTLTTVGLGDLAPHTEFGKIFTIIYIFIGIGVIFGFINAVAHHAKEHPMKNFIGGNKKKQENESETV